MGAIITVIMNPRNILIRLFPCVIFENFKAHLKTLVNKFILKMSKARQNGNNTG